MSQASEEYIELVQKEIGHDAIDEKKHLIFSLSQVKPKTVVYEIFSKHDESKLGIIKWHPAWRQYCFFPDSNCVWSENCLREVMLKLQNLTAERKVK